VQLDALNRYRAGKEHKVTIKHELVKNDGHRLIEQVTSRQAALKKADETPALTNSGQTVTEFVENDEKQAWLARQGDLRSSYLIPATPNCGVCPREAGSIWSPAARASVRMRRPGVERRRIYDAALGSEASIESDMS